MTDKSAQPIMSQPANSFPRPAVAAFSKNPPAIVGRPRFPVYLLAVALAVAPLCSAAPFGGCLFGSSATATLLQSGTVLVGVKAGDSAMAELYDLDGITVVGDVTGIGFIPGQGGVARFSFYASEGDDGVSGVLTFSDTGAGVRMREVRIPNLTITGNSAEFGGRARLTDGTKVTFTVNVTDNSPDGSTDTFTISLSNGYSAGGTVMNGNIVVQ